MGEKLMEGVLITPLKIIDVPKGNVFHAMKKSDNGFSGFGEAYFSTIHTGDIKAWKKHTSMTLNLVVPVGKVKFVIIDLKDNGEKEFFDVIIGEGNYQRLTISPGLWMGFQGIGEGLNLIMNVASIEHDPEECLREEIEYFDYDWNNE